MTDDGQWQTVRKPCLLPRKVLMIIFRAKLLDKLRVALSQGELRLPGGIRAAQLASQLNKLGRQSWNVKILERYSHGKGVATYLARYLRGGPISNRRLISCQNGQVTFLVSG